MNTFDPNFNLPHKKIKSAIENPKMALSYMYNNILAEYCYRLPSTYLNTASTLGTNVFSKDWDVLILLDTARVDAVKILSEEYSFICDVDSIKSVGGATSEWVAATFTNDWIDIIENTIILSTSAGEQTILGEKRPTNEGWSYTNLSFKVLERHNSVDLKDFKYSEDVWKFNEQIEQSDGEIRETSPSPRYLTERAIDIGRNMDYDRLILHYHQPHSPYIHKAITEGRELRDYEEDNPRWYIERTGDHQTVWETYLDELRWVLDDVELLLNNIDADRVAISSDHGEAFGEFGLWMHEIGSLHPNVRNVPWVVTSANDSGQYVPEIGPPDEELESAQESALERLRDLGYKY